MPSLLERLPREVRDRVRRIGALADEKGMRVALVGGVVRDLLLGSGSFDIDLAVEGDAIALAGALQKAWGGRLSVHRRFGTATFEATDGFKCDLATAREESYRHPGALPDVRPGRLEADLARRDISINAMALDLGAGGALIDPFDGQGDLKNRRIRVLHDKSFIDDPTRILRVIRFEQRLKFRMERSTSVLLRAAVRAGGLTTVHPHRLRDEVVLIFKEADPLRAWRRVGEVAGYGFISPRMRFDRRWIVEFAEISRSIAALERSHVLRRSLVAYTAFLSLAFASLPADELRRVVANFGFSRGESSRLLSLREALAPVLRTLGRRVLRPSEIYRVLEPLSYEVILAIRARARVPSVRRRIDAFFAAYNGERLSVGGEDLVGAGVRPGPRFREILERVLWAKIDREVRTREEELALARRIGEELRG